MNVNKGSAKTVIKRPLKCSQMEVFYNSFRRERRCNEYIKNYTTSEEEYSIIVLMLRNEANRKRKH